MKKEESESFATPPPPDVSDLGTCEQCKREGGIILYGQHHEPKRAVLHPNHVMKREGKIVHAGPREPTCGFHAEMAAWDNHAAKCSMKGVEPYPKPMWAV